MTDLALRTAPGQSLSWHLLLLQRCAVCLFIGYLFAFTGWTILPWVMLILALVSMRSISAGTPVTLAITLVIALHFLWVVVIYICSVLEIMPTFSTYSRWTTFRAANLDEIMICASQFLYILTLPLRNLPPDTRFLFRDDKAGAWTAIVVALILSFFINRMNFLISGGYEGNLNEYWPGLPVFFIAAISAWTLHHRKPGLPFLIILNTVVLYWILTGNRSEVLTLFVFGNVMFFLSKSESHSTKWRNVVAAGVLVAGFILFSIVGIVRSEGISGEPFIYSIFSGMLQDDRLNISTVGSSVYSAIVAFEIAQSRGIYYGETFFGQFINTIPSFMNTPWERYVNPYFYYNTSYQTMGGFGILGESYLNFGKIGPVMMAAIFAVILRVLAMSAGRSFLCSWILLAFCIYSQRFIFYGYVYLHNFIVLFAIVSIATWVWRLGFQGRLVAR